MFSAAQQTMKMKNTNMCSAVFQFRPLLERPCELFILSITPRTRVDMRSAGAVHTLL